MSKITNDDFKNYLMELHQNNETHAQILYEECYKICEKQCHYKQYIFYKHVTKDDFFQDSMIHLLKYYDKYDPNISRFSTWYSTLLNNLYLNYYRKIKNEMKDISIYYEVQEDDSEISLQDYIETEKSAEETFINKERYDQLYNLIQNLPIEEKTILYKCKIAGELSKDVSKELNISEKTLNMRIFRIKKKLETQIQELEIDR